MVLKEGMPLSVGALPTGGSGAGGREDCLEGGVGRGGLA